MTGPAPSVFPPTGADLSRVRDVIVCTTDNSSSVSPEEIRAHPPIDSGRLLRLTGAREPVELGRGVVICRLESDDADAVMDACTPKGLKFAPYRQFGQRYSFVREVDHEEGRQQPFRWDPDGVLWDALAYSRLIRDNGYSTQFAARVIDFDDGDRMIAYTLGPESKHAYRLRQDREWLDPDEGKELSALLAAYWKRESAFPERVRRALWRTEYASWMRWADLTIPILVSALESLLTAERYRATHQFVGRVPPLAEELGIDGVSRDYCERMYDARSSWVHGGHVQLFSETTGPADTEERAALAEVAVLQDVLRAAARRCIEDDDFAETFADDDLIRDRWPL